MRVFEVTFEYNLDSIKVIASNVKDAVKKAIIKLKKQGLTWCRKLHNITKIELLEEVND
jgi:hypothetical protein